METIKLETLIDVYIEYSNIERLSKDSIINISPETKALVDYCVSFRSTLNGHFECTPSDAKRLMKGEFLDKMITLLYIFDNIVDVIPYKDILMYYKNEVILIKDLVNITSNNNKYNHDIETSYNNVFKMQLREDKLNQIFGD